jgi:tetraacyldisaccharide 4'-kinase
MNLRATLYHHNILLQQTKLPARVVSVGNLALGGSGKTPLVLYLARLLQKLDRNPAILSRGYKGSAAQPVNVVTDGKAILLDADKAGDEPVLMAESLTGVPVLTGRKRVCTGEYAIHTFQSDTLLLDDGFQHMAIGRDLDLVLFNAGIISGADYLKENRVFPGGYFREPVNALQRADAFIITGVNTTNRKKCSDFKEELLKRFPGKPVFMGEYRLAGFHRVDHQGGKLYQPDDPAISDLSFLGFCGIANPVSFEQSLSEFKINVVDTLSYADHHHYTGDDITELQRIARQKGVDALLTTEKDLVKIRALPAIELPLYSLLVDLYMEDFFDEFVADCLRS